MNYHAKDLAINLMVAAFLLGCLGQSALAGSSSDRVYTQGVGQTIEENLLDCSHVRGARESAVGQIRSEDDQIWITPSMTHWAEGPKATDIYNSCFGIEPANAAEFDASAVPVTDVDPDGELVTGYIFADNYFEFYVNGQLIAVDTTPFTPFNASIVKFRASRPMTLAFKLVDWEENLGIGTEYGRSRAPNHPGDGGAIASFDNGVVTDASWKAQSFYIAPLQSADQVVENGNIHDTRALGRVYPLAPSDAACGLNCFAVRYPEPENWFHPEFDDSNWPNAFEYTEDEVGTRQRAFQVFRDPLTKGGASFIWSANLVLDNVVLARTTIE